MFEFFYSIVHKDAFLESKCLYLVALLCCSSHVLLLLSMEAGQFEQSVHTAQFFLPMQTSQKHHSVAGLQILYPQVYSSPQFQVIDRRNGFSDTPSKESFFTLEYSTASYDSPSVEEYSGFSTAAGKSWNWDELLALTPQLVEAARAVDEGDVATACGFIDVLEQMVSVSGSPI
ncbi:unnamed protein product [Eruca vesicaria subsp. sativa]|uniref:Uncharacterized protein n=1 Tax=Eruca vesicaria subsp. sativa TaxID=29727 RepID=A0ABC8LV90_ERUVS|nr:unnamed protein product [Eruca vesicaria subsp. sativa]